MRLILFLICGLVSFTRLQAQTLVLEPDNYANGTVLNHVLPEVSLTTAGSDNLPIPPVSFDITATTSSALIPAPTGMNVFGHVNVPFFNTDRRLRMDFNGRVSFISILFNGSTSLASERGRLDVFDASGTLITFYQTQPLLIGQTETMSITRPLPDIAWATAYTLPGDNPFGRLDHLEFSTPVPEPRISLLLIGFAAGFALCRRSPERPLY
jgi:hypothetical protein